MGLRGVTVRGKGGDIGVQRPLDWLAEVHLGRLIGHSVLDYWVFIEELIRFLRILLIALQIRSIAAFLLKVIIEVILQIAQ